MLSGMSIESALNETAEFHVVTKKKKTKKRQMFEDSTGTRQNKSVRFRILKIHAIAVLAHPPDRKNIKLVVILPMIVNYI